jgi:hypothetical protein
VPITITVTSLEEQTTVYVTEDETVTDVVTDTVVIVSETIIEPLYTTETSYTPVGTPTAEPTIGNPGSTTTQWNDDDDWETQAPVPTTPSETTQWETITVTQDGQPQTGEQPPETVTFTTFEETLPPETVTFTSTEEMLPPETVTVTNTDQQSPSEEPPVTVTIVQTDEGQATEAPPVYETVTVTAQDEGQPLATGQPPPVTEAPPNTPAATTTQSIIPESAFTPGPDAPTDVEPPPIFDPGTPNIIIPQEMQSPPKCGPNIPNCAENYYCDPQPLCSIGQNCPGLCLPKLASQFSQPEGMRNAVWDKAMKEGVYRIKLIVTEIRTAIPINTVDRWMALGSNKMVAATSTDAMFRNASVSVASSFLSPVSMMRDVAATELESSSPIKSSSISAGVKSSAPILSSSKVVKLKSSVPIIESSKVAASSSLVPVTVEGKWLMLNETSNSTAFNRSSRG